MALLEGLEVVIKPLSGLSHEIDNILRFDAEHYQDKYDKINFLIQRHPVSILRDLIISPVMTGHTPSMQVKSFYGGNIPFIKTDNLRSNNIVRTFKDYLTEAGAFDLKSSELKENDVILTIIGATTDVVGRAAIITPDILPARINQNIALIRPNPKKVNPEYLNVYLNTKYGRGSLHHHSRQTEQVNLNCREVERVLVPLFDEIPSEIEKICLKSRLLTDELSELYTQAEGLLLEILAMADFTPSSEPVNIKSFKESFGVSGRLDSEYYQIKYEQFERACNRFFPLVRIGDISVYNMRGVQPIYVENGVFNVINSKHILEKGLDYRGFEKTSRDFFDVNKRAHVFRNDILIYTTGANIGRTQVYMSNDAALASNHVNILRLDGLNPLYVSFFLNAKKFGRLQTEKLSAGSAQQELYPKDIDNFYIPVVPTAIQHQIAELVQQSFVLKAQSEHLLDVAKRAVEIAIEQDEAAALAYIAHEVKDGSE